MGREFHAGGPCVIGRADGCDVVLPDTNVSRRHARIEAGPAGYVLKDLDSANGTWLGDRRIKEVSIDHLDRFRVGTTVLELLRDDDRTGNVLEMARTTAVPVKEILEGIRVALGTREEEGKLEDEGERIVVAGNRPFLLDDPGSMWLVESGRIDVFTVAVRDGEPAGARSHFVSVEAAFALFGMDLSAYGTGFGFLASGKGGTRLRRILLSRLRELASEERYAARITGLLENWTSSLAKALVRDIPPGRPVDEELEEGRESILDFQRRARARRGTAWVEVFGGSLLFIGLSEVGPVAERLVFPVTRDGWIESARDGLLLTPIRPASVLLRAELWRGLESFHRALCECEFINKKLATVDEFHRLASKAQHAESARAAALKEIGDVLAGPVAAKVEAADAGEGEPVFQACRYVCSELGMDARKPPDPRPEWTFEENLQAVSLASRFRTRGVALRGEWWKEEHGPILASVEATKAPVALLQAAPGAYDWVDPGTGRRQRVTRELAETLDPFAYVLYRRFPDGVLAARDVIKFGARGMRRDLLTLVTMGLAMGLLGAVTPYFTGQVFDMAIPRADRGLLTQFAVALLVSAIASSAFKMAQSIATLRIQGRMDYAIQSALWDRLLDLPSTFFRKYSAGDLADRAQGIDAIWQLLAGAGIGAVLGTLSSVFYVLLMLSYSVSLTLVGILLTLVFVGITTAADVLQLRAQREQLTLRGKLTGLVIQLIEGVGKLRVSGSEDHGFRAWAKDFAEQRRIGFRVGRIHNGVVVLSSAYPLLSSIAIFATLLWAQETAASGGHAAAITTGEFIAFYASFGLFLGAVQALGDASMNLLKAVPIWERLKPILETPPEIDDAKAAPSRLKGEIEISHLSFRYTSDGPPVLRDVSLSIKAGAFVALVGPSGCGKSTLMRVLLGFEKQDKGGIYYDGQDLTTLDVRLVRRQLGVVLQNSCVLPADIYRNIVGTSSRTIDEAWEAAESSGFAEDIREMPMGMHTFVSEGGGSFSGGQRQRLMIARAIVNKPRIIFLDEATSALDNRTQEIVTESLNRMRATRVAIAHRLSTIMKADRIFYLEAGTIVEAGTYDELMGLGGKFFELASRQQA